MELTGGSKGKGQPKEDTESSRAQKYPQEFKLVRNPLHPHHSNLPLKSTMWNPHPRGIRPGELPISTPELDTEGRREMPNMVSGILSWTELYENPTAVIFSSEHVFLSLGHT